MNLRVGYRYRFVETGEDPGSNKQLISGENEYYRLNVVVAHIKYMMN